MGKKIVIAHVITSLKIGGAETLLSALVEQLQSSLNVENHVIFFRAGPHKERLESCGIPVYQVTGLFSLYDPFFFRTLYTLIKRIRPDCIHSCLWSANVTSRIVARLLDIPHISALHNNLDQDGLVRSCLDRLTQKYSHTLVPVSYGVAQSLFKRDPWVDHKKITIIKNGINRAEVHKEALAYPRTREQLGLSRDHYIVGSVGRFVLLKNYPLLLHSFSQFHLNHPEARLILMGQGPQEKELRKIVETLNIEHSVSFIGGQVAYSYYSLFDCFVLSSFKEGISMALLEAMSFSIPSIVTHSDIQHDVIKDNFNGLLVPSENKGAMVAALESLYSNKDLRHMLGHNAKKMIDDSFDLNITIQQYHQLYEHVIRSFHNVF